MDFWTNFFVCLFPKVCDHYCVTFPSPLGAVAGRPLQVVVGAELRSLLSQASSLPEMI